MPIVNTLNEPRLLVDRLYGVLCDQSFVDHGLFVDLRERCYENLCRASSVVPHSDHKSLKHAMDSDEPIGDVIEAYLASTPFPRYLMRPVPLKDDNGWYSDRGKPAVESLHRDYVRLGGELGVSIVSDDEYLPLSLTTSYIRLHPVSGMTEIGYFANSLTYSLDPNKYFGVSLNYMNGTREDTAARQSQWEIALSGHF